MLPIGIADNAVLGPRLAALALTVAATCLTLSFPGWREETDDRGSVRDVKPFPSTRGLTLAFTFSTFASLLALIAMLWTHVANVAMVTVTQDISYGAVEGKLGTVGLVIGWVAVASIAVGASGLSVMHYNIRMLKTLTDD